MVVLSICIWGVVYYAITDAHGQRSLMGYSPQDHKELDTTE